MLERVEMMTSVRRRDDAMQRRSRAVREELSVATRKMALYDQGLTKQRVRADVARSAVWTRVWRSGLLSAVPAPDPNGH